MSRFRILFARLIALILFRGPVIVKLGRKAFIFNPRTGALTPSMAGGAPDDDADDADKADDADTASDDADDSAKSDDDAADKAADSDADKTDWKAMARKHEARAKKVAKERDELAAKQKKIDEANATDHEKAITKAREEATSEVTSKYETERRAERLELAVTRSATKGVKLTVDGEEKTVKFADPDDAMAHLERAIKRGDVDGEDIYTDDGKVDKDALNTALVELLEDKPHLRASNGNGAADRKSSGDADLGKGKGGGKGLEDMSPEDHLKALQKR